MPYKVQYQKNSKLDEVEVVEASKPAIENDQQVLLRYILNPVNPSDLGGIRGYYPGFKPESYPAVPGLEGLARVEEIGKGVTKVQVGQRVVALDINDFPKKVGTWQDYYLADELDLVVVPDEISDETAAQILANPLSAAALIKVLQVPPNEYLLQTAAGSVFGRLLIQFAKINGIKTINLVRRKEQVEELKAIGADEVLCTSEGTNIVEEIKKITQSKLAYAAVDTVGGELGITVSQSIRNSGKILLFGVLGGKNLTVSGVDMLFRGITYSGFWVTPYLKSLGRDKSHQLLKDVFNTLITNKIEPLAGEKYPFSKIHEAIQKSLEPGRGGKVLLEH